MAAALSLSAIGCNNIVIKDKSQFFPGEKKINKNHACTIFHFSPMLISGRFGITGRRPDGWWTHKGEYWPWKAAVESSDDNFTLLRRIEFLRNHSSCLDQAVISTLAVNESCLGLKVRDEWKEIKFMKPMCCMQKDGRRWTWCLLNVLRKMIYGQAIEPVVFVDIGFSCFFRNVICRSCEHSNHRGISWFMFELPMCCSYCWISAHC